MTSASFFPFSSSSLCSPSCRWRGEDGDTQLVAEEMGPGGYSFCRATHTKLWGPNGCVRMCVYVCVWCYVCSMYACLLPANYKAGNGDVTETSTRASMVALRFSVKVWLGPDIGRHMIMIPADSRSLAARQGSRKRLTPDSSFVPKPVRDRKEGKKKTGKQYPVRPWESGKWGGRESGSSQGQGCRRLPRGLTQFSNWRHIGRIPVTPVEKKVGAHHHHHHHHYSAWPHARDMTRCISHQHLTFFFSFFGPNIGLGVQMQLDRGWPARKAKKKIQPLVSGSMVAAQRGRERARGLRQLPVYRCNKTP